MYLRVVLGLLAALLITTTAPYPTVAAVSSIVIDARTGRTLSAQNADQPRYPASLTKMMTLYLLFDALDRGDVGLYSRLPVSRRAAVQPPTKLGLRPGQTITVRDAMLALATKSANDAAVVIAEALAGSEAAFARKMTAKARALGMRRTTFRNASGLHESQQRTTARDMATLGHALVRDHPKRYSIFATRSFRYGSNRYANHNRLLGLYRGMDGIKTGYTNAAGFNLAASARRGNQRLIGVVMNAPTSVRRNGLMVRALDNGFVTAASMQAKTREPQRVATGKRAPTKVVAKTSKKKLAGKAARSKPVYAASGGPRKVAKTSAKNKRTLADARR